jgi:hypothetical protein
MNWRIRGIRRLLCIRFLYLEGRLDDQLMHHNTDKVLPVVSGTKLKRKVTGVLKRSHDQWFQAGLPALYGPSSNRVWAVQLRKLSRIPA